MFCSTIIATIGRSSLSKAVNSVIDQSIKEEFEVIVVNDSGKPLPKAEWQLSDCVKVINTNRRERSFARNAGAAVAKGKYLHFLDDDDWMLPMAFENLKEAGIASEAGWIYGCCRFLDRNGTIITDHHIGVTGNCFVQVMAGEWIPLPASLIRSDLFFLIGGFNTNFSVSEDQDLCRRIIFRSDLAKTDAIVACALRDSTTTTTDYGQALKNSIISRDTILNEPGSFSRITKSVTSAYWHGRLVRAYLTCVILNLKRHKILTALSRLLFALAALLSARLKLCSKKFWRGLLRSHSREGVF